MSNTIKSPKWRLEIYIPRLKRLKTSETLLRLQFLKEYWGVKKGINQHRVGQNGQPSKIKKTKWNFDFGCGNRKSSAHYANLKTTAEIDRIKRGRKDD